MRAMAKTTLACFPPIPSIPPVSLWPLISATRNIARYRLSAALSVWHREIIDGRNADYTLAGTRVSYTDPQYDGQGVSARFGFEQQVSETITLAATVAGYGTAEQTDGWTFGVSLLSQF